MPEGHAVHRLARAVQRRFAADAIAVTSPQGRFAASAARIDGATLRSAQAYGKHLLLDFGAQRWVHVHLGIYGRLTIADPPAGPPVGAVRMRLVGPRAWADLRGPAACDLLAPQERAALLARLGPDPLRRDADPDRAWRRIHASRAPVATLLMDQRVVAGVGNIYRAEVLFRHGVDPLLPGIALPEQTWQAMWADLRVLMRAGVRDGRIDTVRREHEPASTGRAPRRDRHGGEVYVYRRAGQPCHVCGTPVAATVLGGRNLFWCPTCQPART
ncbi:MAG: Fpg/Nei family DNA glycosylase [Jatrophihabitans sp.]|nr:MAG: Fpg/Nei family DNA glycosylase [Jatrophihabitans sp.]